MKTMTVEEALAHSDVHAVPGYAQSVLADEVRRLRAEINSAREKEPDSAGSVIGYTPGDWYMVKDHDELEAFFLSRLQDIREAARKLGYAIGLHGSLRRDLDLIATPWIAGAADKETLANAISVAACGFSHQGPYYWEDKPLGRVATSMACCWTPWPDVPGSGHIDLSVVSAEPAVPMGSTLQVVMGELAKMLDEDQFARIEGIVIRDGNVAPEPAAPAKSEFCRHCGGQGLITVMSDGGPDAYEIDVNCPRCKGECVEPAALAVLPEWAGEWLHKSGNAYRVIAVANADAKDVRYPLTIIYQGEDGRVWSRLASDWHASMSRDPAATVEWSSDAKASGV